MTSNPNIYVIDGDKKLRQFGQTPISSSSPPHGQVAVYVDYQRGDDVNIGTSSKYPVRTKDVALKIWRRLTNKE